MPPKDQQGPNGLRTLVQKRIVDDVLHNSMSKSSAMASVLLGVTKFLDHPPDSWEQSGPFESCVEKTESSV